jgi:hypothetical protein
MAFPGLNRSEAGSDDLLFKEHVILPDKPMPHLKVFSFRSFTPSCSPT